MTAPPLLKLGTRRSPLALAQAEEARSRLCAAHGWAADAIELVTVIASGDKIQDRALADLGGKALWTRELDQWLAEARIDAAVHSLKDVETWRPDSLALAAILPRADKRDVLVGAASLAALPQGAVIGTSAPRRAAQLLHARPDCSVVTFRGNVATRLAKLAAGDVDATFLAAAGLARLGETGTGHPLAAEEWLPAPSQGAIGVECRAADTDTKALLAAIDHAPSRAEAEAERALLAALGGSCHSPVAVLCDAAGSGLAMRAALFSPDGLERVDGQATFAAGDRIGPERLAADLLARAGPGIAPHFAGQKMSVPIVVVRPQPGCDATVIALAQRGLTAVAAPLSAVVPRAWQVPVGDAFDGLLVGSANVFRLGGAQLAALRTKPVYAVGATTAAAARAEGFEVAMCGTGGLQAVLDGILGPTRLLRLAGADHVALALPPQVEVKPVVVYATEPRAMPEAAVKILSGGDTLVLLHSATSALRLRDECDRLQVPRERATLAALGPRILAAAGPGWANALSAREPSEAALLALATDLCHASGPREGA